MQIGQTLDRPLAAAAVTTFFVTDMKYQRKGDMNILSCLRLRTDALKSPTSTQFSIRFPTRVWLRLIAFVLVLYTLMIIL